MDPSTKVDKISKAREAANLTSSRYKDFQNDGWPLELQSVFDSDDHNSRLAKLAALGETEMLENDLQIDMQTFTVNRDKSRYEALLAACITGKAESVKTLLANGTTQMSYEVFTEGGSSWLEKLKCHPIPMYVACYYDNHNCLGELINGGGQISMFSHFNPTLLQVTIEQNSISCLKILLENNIDVNGGHIHPRNMYWAYSEVPLILAIARKRVQIVQLLIQAGAKLDVADHWGLTPLVIAAQFGHLQSLQSLLQHGADMNYRISNQHKTALIAAAEQGQFLCLCALLEEGAYYMTSTSSGLNALIAASQNGHRKCLHAILKRASKSFINANNQDGESALFLAAENGHLDCIKLLLQYDSNVELARNDGKSVLMAAASSGSPECVGYLIERVAQVGTMDKYGNNALIYAAKNKNVKVIELLVGRGIEVNSCNNNQETALLYAAGTSDPDTLEYLLKCGSQINHQSRSGQTPLMQSVKYKNTESLKSLLQFSANVNMTNSYGYHALMIASITNDIKSVKLLLQAGSDVNKRDLRGSNAADVCKNKDILRLLWLAGANMKYVKSPPKLDNFNSSDHFPTLQQLSRQIIRHTVSTNSTKGNLFVTSKKLGLPDPLVDFILYDTKME